MDRFVIDEEKLVEVLVEFADDAGLNEDWDPTDPDEYSTIDEMVDRVTKRAVTAPVGAPCWCPGEKERLVTLVLDYDLSKKTGDHELAELVAAIERAW